MDDASEKDLVLVVDDDPNALYALQTMLESCGYAVAGARTVAEAVGRVGAGGVDVILTDYHMEPESGLDLIKAVRPAHPGVPIILMTGDHSTGTAIEASRLGAFEYFLKGGMEDDAMEELAQLMQRAVAARRAHKHVEQRNRESGLAKKSGERDLNLGEKKTHPAEQPDELIIGRTGAMRQVLMTIGRVAPKPVTVLVRGETGTGKELVARAVHLHSERSKEALVIVNCVAIPEPLLEKELFGHEAGAFTGAQNAAIGKFEQANHGTLFLDEIGDISMAMQAKLLRVLEEKSIQRLGGHAVISLDVRVIAATHCDLEKAVEEGRFRQDLYYRLNDAVIRVPSLRERRDDIPDLATTFLRKHPQSAVLRPVIMAEALEFLKHSDWPGNVRELRNVVYKAAVEAHGYPIDVPILRRIMDKRRLGEREPAKTLKSVVGQLLHSAISGQGKNVRAAVEEWVENELYRQAFALAAGDQTKIAKWLGISRPTVRQKLTSLGLREPSSMEGK